MEGITIIIPGREYQRNRYY